jgi:multiple sugar transport system substrate-binding protein
MGWTYYLWLWAAGADFYDNPQKPSKSIINSRESRNALQFQKNMIYKDKIAPTFAQASSFGNSQEMFESGKVAMIIEGHWMVPAFKGIKSFRWDVAALPASKSERGELRANYGAGSCFSIPKQSKNPDNAWRLVKFLGSDKAQQILVSSGLSTPSLRTPLITKTFLSASPPANNKVFLDMIPYAHLPPMIWNYNEMNDMMYRELDYFWLNEKNIDQTLSSLQKNLDDILRK